MKKTFGEKIDQLGKDIHLFFLIFGAIFGPMILVGIIAKALVGG